MRKRSPVFNSKTDLDDPKLQSGMLFATTKMFRDVVTKQAIRECMNNKRTVKFVYEAKSPEDICFQDCGGQTHARSMYIKPRYMHKHFSPKTNKLKMDYCVV